MLGQQQAPARRLLRVGLFALLFPQKKNATLRFASWVFSTGEAASYFSKSSARQKYQAATER